MKMLRLVIALAVILVTLNVFDVFTTKAAIAMGCKENNEFAIALFTTFGYAIGLLVKFGAAAMIGCLTIYSYNHDSRALRIILTTCLIYAVSLYVLVVTNNIINMFK